MDLSMGPPNPPLPEGEREHADQAASCVRRFQPGMTREREAVSLVLVDPERRVRSIDKAWTPSYVSVTSPTMVIVRRFSLKNRHSGVHRKIEPGPCGDGTQALGKAIAAPRRPAEAGPPRHEA